MMTIRGCESLLNVSCAIPSYKELIIARFTNSAWKTTHGWAEQDRDDTFKHRHLWRLGQSLWQLREIHRHLETMAAFVVVVSTLLQHRKLSKFSSLSLKHTRKMGRFRAEYPTVNDDEPLVAGSSLKKKLL